MKHTDLAIIFSMIFLCFIVEYDFKINSLQEIQSQKLLYNNIFDTAVCDALRNGLEDDNDASVKINENLVLQQLFDGLKELLKIDMTSFPAIIITNKSGFTVWSNGIRSEVFYEDDSIATKINTIKKVVEEALNSSTTAKYNNFSYQVSIPYIEASEWYNTISNLGFLMVFQGDTFNNNSRYNRYIVSGASFKYIESK